MDEAPVYRHVTYMPYPSRMIASASCVVVALGLLLAFSMGSGLSAFAFVIDLVVFVLLLGPMGRLEISMTKATISYSFGNGIYRRTLALADFAGAHVEQLGFWARLSASGNLFSPRLLTLSPGLPLVALQVRDGQRFYVGTDRPDDLIEALGIA
jgi:hypothetical protein